MPEPVPEPAPTASNGASSPAPSAPKPSEPRASDPKQAARAKPDDDERVIIRPYPKAVFLYPLAVCALVCGILTGVGAADQHTVGFVFMCFFFVNLIILSFEFTRYVSVAVVLSILVVVLLGMQLNAKLRVVDFVRALYNLLEFHANAGFYFGIFVSYVIVVIGIIVDTRYDFWELRGNEVLHHHGFSGDVERFPAPQLKIKKEIADVFEYLLLGSGRLVIYPEGAERAVVLENVPRINYLEEQITHKLHALKVQVDIH